MKNKIIYLLILAVTLQFFKAQVVLQALDAPSSMQLPDGWTLEVQPIRYLASVYDNNYYPMNVLDLSSQPPTAQLGSQNANATTDPLLNYQGRIGAYNVSGGSFSLKIQEAFDRRIYHVPITFINELQNDYSFMTFDYGNNKIISEAIIPAMYIKNANTDKKVYLQLYWGDELRLLTTDNKRIEVNAFICAEEPIELVQLDMNRGIGQDGKGILLTTFNISFTTSKGVMSKPLELRLLPAIPDRYADQKTSSYAGTWAADEYEHDMFYMPITGPDGNTWLNNNLGAGYSQLAFYDFNPLQQAKSYNDRNAFGSIFEYLRKPDGHELTNYDENGNASGKYGETTTVAISINDAGTNKYIVGRRETYTWYPGPVDNYNNIRQWNIDGLNAPCPKGFHVPANKVNAMDELRNLYSKITGQTAYTSNASFTSDPIMKFTVGRARFTTNSFTSTDYFVNRGRYFNVDAFIRNSDPGKLAVSNIWADPQESGYYGWYHWSSGNPMVLAWGHDGGYIRCIKD
ncbi:hypothetical protein PG630_05460 [Riemerella anatipestifer]|nr:hypothetical protein [Riemerella anatipestifer]